MIRVVTLKFAVCDTCKCQVRTEDMHAPKGWHVVMIRVDGSWQFRHTCAKCQEKTTPTEAT